MMVNDEVLWNFSVDENYYDIFPLASIYDPLYTVANVPPGGSQGEIGEVGPRWL